jgi:hypothetical protein
MFTFDWRSRSIDVYKRLIHRDRSKVVSISMGLSTTDINKLTELYLSVSAKL